MIKRLTFALAIFLVPSLVSSDDNLRKSKLFIEELGKQVIEKVSNDQLTATERHSNFKDLYLAAFDNYYISRFVLGRYWKQIDKNVQTDFVESFNNYLVTTYAPKFKGWQGTFKATDSSLENNYYNVQMDLINEEGPVVKLQWKMYLDKNKKFKILDVNLEGVSMLVTQRAEFSSVIKNNPKGVIGLIEAMKKKASEYSG